MQKQVANIDLVCHMFIANFTQIFNLCTYCKKSERKTTIIDRYGEKIQMKQGRNFVKKIEKEEREEDEEREQEGERGREV